MTTGVAVAYVQLLGNAGARIGVQQVPFVADKRFQLLAYLAYQGDWVSRERASFLFWPDTDTHNAKQNLRGLLHRIRALDWLSGLEANAHQLRWSVRTDVGVLKEALEAGRVEDTLPLYQGPLLSDLEGDEGGEFGEWLEMERGRLHGLWRETLLGEVQKSEASGHHDLAAQLLRTLMERDPLDEEGMQAYMRSAVKAGQQQQALSAYRAFVKRLHAELEMEPASASEQLAKEIENALSMPRPIPKTPIPEVPAAFQLNSPPREIHTVEGTGSPLLPKPGTSFVGRDLELADIVHLLSQEDCRLLTLVGAGGAGKTRLSLQASQELSQNYPDGVYFVPLAALMSAISLPNALANVLGLEFRGQEEPLGQVIDFLEKKRLLLVLDNYEHLLEAATTTTELLHGCPNLKILVTSRERLNVEEEWLLPVDGLSYPKDADGLERASAHDAMQLFIQRARRVQPSFALTEEVLPHVIEVCRLVQGFPLGIELAAAWVRAMSVEEIAKEIGKDYDFLSSDSRNLPDRHRSIRAAFESSWRLLSPVEQGVLRKLAVFQGGFRKEAAAYVANASYAVLAALTDKSLLRVSPAGRYDLHPLVYQYILEKLKEQPEEQTAVREKHGRYYHAFLLAREGAEDQTHDLGDIELEIENVRASLTWCLGAHPNELHRVLETITQFFDLRGRNQEGESLLAQAATQLDEAEPKQRAVLGAVLVNRAWFCYRLNDHRTCRQLAEHGLQLTSFPADCIPVLLGHNILAALASEGADYTEAKRLRKKLAELIAEVIDKAYLPGHLAVRALAANLGNSASIEIALGNYEEAKRLLEKALSLNKSIGHKGHVADVLDELGEVLIHLRRPSEALRVLQESLELARELEMSSHIPGVLINIATAYLDLKQLGKADELVQEGLHAARDASTPLTEFDALIVLGRMATQRGDVALAHCHLRRALEIGLTLQATPQILDALLGFAALRLKQEKVKEAELLLRLLANHPRTTFVTRVRVQELLAENCPTSNEDAIPITLEEGIALFS